MKVTDTITSQRIGVDEAYERFFDGFYNLGRPGEIFERTMVLAPPKPVSRRATARSRARSSARRRARRRLASK
jgi:hypothetical protein